MACRLLLFDPVLNLASGSPVSAVGQTALNDCALRWLAAQVGWPDERVRRVVWLLSVEVACLLLIVEDKPAAVLRIGR